VDEGEAVGLPSKKLEEWYSKLFKPNEARGISYFMYYIAALTFCKENDITSIVRGHEVQKYGYFEHKYRKKDREYPLVITVFSAPNYCDMYENRAAILKINNDNYDFIQQAWVDHPYDLPDFQNAFAFSLPFLSENVTKFCFNILSICNDNESEDEENQREQREQREQQERIRKKILNMGRIMKGLQNQRLEREKRLKPINNLNLDSSTSDRFKAIVEADTGENLPRSENVLSNQKQIS